jgi:hypothetical protein
MFLRMATATPITTESILQEDGAAAALGKFAAEVRTGEEETRKYLAEAEPSAVWTFRGLRDAVFEAAGGKLRKTAVTVALMSLDKVGVVRIDYARSTVVVHS